MLRPVLAIVLLNAGCALAQLNGRIVSPDGALEGVVVSARKEGSPVSVSVVSNAAGEYAFPAGRLEPGRYGMRIRATGYELDGPLSVELADAGAAEVELKLRKAAERRADGGEDGRRVADLGPAARRTRHGQRCLGRLGRRCRVARRRKHLRD